jgi:hypothetical protein
MENADFQRRYRIAVRRARGDQRFTDTALCWFCVVAVIVMFASLAV